MSRHLEKYPLHIRQLALSNQQFLRRITIYALIALLSLVTTTAAYGMAMTDDFEDDTTQGWAGGATPTVVTSGGPAGVGDSYLTIQSNGIAGPGSRLITRNNAQWALNFPSNNIDQLTMHLRCESCTGTMSMRVAIGNHTSGNAGTWFASTVPFDLPNDGQWHEASFSLNSADMSNIRGTTTHTNTLNGAASLRILHSVDPNHKGDIIAAKIAIDNIIGSSSAPPTAIRLANQNTAQTTSVAIIALWFILLLFLTRNAVAKRKSAAFRLD